MLQKPIPSERAPNEAGQARALWAAAIGLVAICMLALGLIFSEAVRGAVTVWWDSRTYNHCFLVLPISLFLIWDRRTELLRLLPRPNLSALLLLLPIGLAWLFAYFAGVLEAQQFLIVAMLQVMLLTVLGWQIYRLLLFPLLYLFFLVPTGGFLVPVLQDFTASFVVHGLQIFGIPVFSDGVFITIPNGNFEVAEACAGLRFLIASIAFGFLFAYVVYRSWSRRLLFIALSLLVPVIANGLRALGIVLLAHYSNNTIAVGFDHVVYGWLFFSLVTLLLIWFGFLLREGPISRPPAVVTKTAPMAARLHPGRAIVAGILAILLVAAPRAYAEWREATVPPVDIAAFQAPDVAPPWQKVAGGVDRWQPRFVGPDAELRQDYIAGDKRVYLYIAFYARQRYGAKAVSAENRLADDVLWTRSGSGTARAEVEGAPLTLATERMMAGKTKRVVWWWYWVNGRFTANGIVAKLLQAEAEIFGGDRSAAVVAVGTDSDSLGTERETLPNFLAALTRVKPMLDRVAEQ